MKKGELFKAFQSSRFSASPASSGLKRNAAQELNPRSVKTPKLINLGNKATNSSTIVRHRPPGPPSTLRQLQPRPHSHPHQMQSVSSNVGGRAPTRSHSEMKTTLPLTAPFFSPLVGVPSSHARHLALAKSVHATAPRRTSSLITPTTLISSITNASSKTGDAKLLPVAKRLKTHPDSTAHPAAHTMDLRSVALQRAKACVSIEQTALKNKDDRDDAERTLCQQIDALNIDGKDWQMKYKALGRIHRNRFRVTIAERLHPLTTGRVFNNPNRSFLPKTLEWNPKKKSINWNVGQGTWKEITFFFPVHCGPTLKMFYSSAGVCVQ